VDCERRLLYGPQKTFFSLLSDNDSPSTIPDGHDIVHPLNALGSQLRSATEIPCAIAIHTQSGLVQSYFGNVSNCFQRAKDRIQKAGRTGRRGEAAQAIPSFFGGFADRKCFGVREFVTCNKGLSIMCVRGHMYSTGRMSLPAPPEPLSCNVEDLAAVGRCNIQLAVRGLPQKKLCHPNSPSGYLDQQSELLLRWSTPEEALWDHGISVSSATGVCRLAARIALSGCCLGLQDVLQLFITPGVMGPGLSCCMPGGLRASTHGEQIEPQ
jgi:hypothetical protein